MIPSTPNSSISTHRIAVIDALRGFALAGIIVNHCSQHYLAGPTPPSAGTLNLFSPLDFLLGDLSVYLTSGKFFTIFSFLFGLSFAIQMDSAAKNGRAFVGRTAWRLVILFGIGFIHSLFYSGDILRIYALLGLFLILMRKLNNRALIIIGLLLVLNTPLIIGRIMTRFAPPPTAAQIEAGKAGYAAFVKTAEEGYRIKQSGSLSEVVEMNLKGGLIGTLGFQLMTGRLFITLGLFLLGLWAGRKHIFTDTPQNRHFFRRLLLWSGVLALISTALVIINGGFQMGGPPQSWKDVIMATAFDVHQATLSAFYVSALTLLVWQKKATALRPLMAVGRMGLTTYLMGTAFGVLIFLGYGFGQLGHLGLAVSIGLGLAFFILQIPFSNWWLARYQFGPVEWLWRSLTYRKAQEWKQKSTMV